MSLSTPQSRLSSNELTLWLNYIEHEVGFVLPVSQVSWVKGVIERHLADTGLNTPKLIDAITHDRQRYHQLFDDILIPRTQFFRHLPSFELIDKYVQHWQLHQSTQNQLKDVPSLTAWSVGCSTGQEAVSMAMTLNQSLSATKNFLVYGSDFHQQSLQQAKNGEYDINELPFIPQAYVQDLQITDKKLSVSSDLKKHLHFFSQNLVQLSNFIPLLPSQCQIIMCKNVLIYFRQFEQRDIVHYLAQFLAKDGIMILGVGELVQINAQRLVRLPLATVNAYCRADADDWVKNLKI